MTKAGHILSLWVPWWSKLSYGKLQSCPSYLRACSILLSYRERMSFVSVQTDATYSQIETIWKGYSILSKLIPKKQGQPGNCKWGKTRNSLQRDGSFQNFLGTELKICFQSSPDHIECYVTSAMQCLLYRLPHNHLRQLLPSSPLQSWANWDYVTCPQRVSPRTTSHTSNPLSNVPAITA